MKIKTLAIFVCFAFDVIATLFGCLLLAIALSSESASIVIDGASIDDGIGLLRTIGAALVFISLQLLWKHAEDLRGDES